MNDKTGKASTPKVELTQFKIVEKEYEVEVPKYVEKVIELPIFKDVEYERPIIVEKTYEKPIVTEKDITEGLRQLVMGEVQKGIAEAIRTLKVAFEIPMSRILQVRPGGKIHDVGD